MDQAAVSQALLWLSTVWLANLSDPAGGRAEILGRRVLQECPVEGTLATVAHLRQLHAGVNSLGNCLPVEAWLVELCILATVAHVQQLHLMKTYPIGKSS